MYKRQVYANVQESGCGESSAESSASSGEDVACDISVLERLIRSHPVWFLPGIQRAGAFHLLQGKEDGVSIAILYFVHKRSQDFR